MSTLNDLKKRLWRLYDDQPILVVAPTVMIGAAAILYYRRCSLLPLEAIQVSSQVAAAARAVHSQMENPFFIDPLAGDLAGVPCLTSMGTRC